MIQYSYETGSGVPKWNNSSLPTSGNPIAMYAHKQEDWKVILFPIIYLGANYRIIDEPHECCFCVNGPHMHAIVVTKVNHIMYASPTGLHAFNLRNPHSYTCENGYFGLNGVKRAHSYTEIDRVNRAPPTSVVKLQEIGPEMTLQLVKGDLDEEGTKSDKDEEEQKGDPCTLAIET
ncbi:hypothetical protein VNO77_04094 [Canavalia gladiata]|uniref:Uncharacterized protein n=1 Tax=Canavalia gladiata TaxID=3824 RepID=A0AAN9R7G4_CANGL